MELFSTIRRAPVRFLCGVAIIVLGVFLLWVLLYDRSVGLWIGTQAGFQGAGYLILYRYLRKKVQAEGS